MVPTFVLAGCVVAARRLGGRKANQPGRLQHRPQSARPHAVLAFSDGLLVEKCSQSMGNLSHGWLHSLHDRL